MTLPYSFLALSLASLLVGCIVFNDRPRRAANQAFLGFSLGVSLWIGSFGLLLTTGNQIYIVLLNCGGLLLVYGLTRFATVFPAPSPLPVRPFLFWSPLLIGGSSMLFTNTVVLHVKVLPGFRTLVTHGELIWLWSLLLLAYILISLALFARGYRSAESEDRIRLRLVYLGMAVFVVCAIVFDALLPAFFGESSLNIVGPLSAFGFLATTAYAIVRHQFMDVRVIIQRGFIYSCAFFLLASTYMVVLGVVHQVSSRVTGLAESLSVAVAISIGMYTLPRIESYFRRVTDPWFFKQRYDYYAILEHLTQIVNENVTLRPMVLESLIVLNDAFKPTYSYFVQPASSYFYSMHNLDLSQLEQESGPKYQLRVPICAGSRQIGEYVLGRKRSGDAYCTEDYSLVRTFTAHAQVAFEKAALYQKLQEHSSQLEAKVEERTRSIHAVRLRERELFDDLSHALQTPLTVLRGGIELLHTSIPTAGSSFQGSLESSIDDLSRLVRSMLKIARVDSEPVSTSSSIIELSVLLAKLQEYTSIIAASESVSIASKIEPNIRISGDAQQIEEALANVLANAIKFTSSCDARKIHVSAQSDDKNAYVLISDTGIGMNEEDRAHAFERFYRSANGSTGRTSTGLGLAITKRIIERHGGTITLESALRIGTTVTITIPLALQVFAPPQRLPLFRSAPQA